MALRRGNPPPTAVALSHLQALRTPGEKECGAGWEPALQSRAARRRQQDALSYQVVRWRARGAARTLLLDQRKQGKGRIWGTAREREVRVGSGARGLRVPKTWSEARVAASPAGREPGVCAYRRPGRSPNSGGRSCRCCPRGGAPAGSAPSARSVCGSGPACCGGAAS